MLSMNGLAFLMAATSFPGEPAVPASPEVEMAVGYKVTNRRLEAIDGDNVFEAGESIVAWSAVSGVKTGFVEHVWFRNGVEVARHYLPVGAGRRWRTWSRHKAGAGEYRIEVLGPDGKQIGESKFVVVQGGGC